MRATIHLVSKRDYWPFVVGIRQAQRKWWLRTHGRDLDAKTIAANDRKVRRAFDGGTLTRAELEPSSAHGSVSPACSSTWCASRRRARGSGVAPISTRSRRTGSGPSRRPRHDGIELLVRRYLQGFGPARPAEIADWASLDVTTTKQALERIELRRFRDEHGKELVDLPRLPLPDADTPAPARFLPVWDATLLVHARRTQILPERPPAADLQHPEPAVREHVPRRRPGRGHVALRPRSNPDRSVRRIRANGAEEARRGGRTACRVPPLGR